MASLVEQTEDNMSSRHSLKSLSNANEDLTYQSFHSHDNDDMMKEFNHHIRHQEEIERIEKEELKKVIGKIQEQ